MEALQTYTLILLVSGYWRNDMNDVTEAVNRLWKLYSPGYMKTLADMAVNIETLDQDKAALWNVLQQVAFSSMTGARVNPYHQRQFVHGICGMTVSKSSSAAEYTNFIGWANKVFPAEAFAALPLWEQVSGWRGKLIAVCNYDASYTPGPAVWNEGYPVWWHLTNVRLLKETIPCRGNVGMWELPADFVSILRP